MKWQQLHIAKKYLQPPNICKKVPNPKNPENKQILVGGFNPYKKYSSNLGIFTQRSFFLNKTYLKPETKKSGLDYHDWSVAKALWVGVIDPKCKSSYTKDTNLRSPNVFVGDIKGDQPSLNSERIQREYIYIYD